MNTISIAICPQSSSHEITCYCSEKVQEVATRFFAQTTECCAVFRLLQSLVSNAQTERQTEEVLESLTEKFSFQLLASVEEGIRKCRGSFILNEFLKELSSLTAENNDVRARLVEILPAFLAKSSEPNHVLFFFNELAKCASLQELQSALDVIGPLAEIKTLEERFLALEAGLPEEKETFLEPVAPFSTPVKGSAISRIEAPLSPVKAATLARYLQ